MDFEADSSVVIIHDLQPIKISDCSLWAW